MQTSAVLLEKPESLSLEMVGLKDPGHDEVVVRVLHSGISTGTEKLLWSGAMPPFQGLGYPLVPGYEAVGEVIQAPKGASVKVGDLVFVPGSNGFVDAKGLFGGSARHLVTPVKRITKINSEIGEKGVLYALAATARHALTGPDAKFPDLIIGHGALGRLLARITIIAGGKPPTVWEIDKKRVEAIKKNGIILYMPDGSVKKVKVKITDNPKEVGIMDVVQISVKGYHTHSAATMAMPMVGEKTYVMSVQNGLGNLQTIANVVGKEKVVGGVTAHSAMPVSLHEIKYAGGMGGVWIGRFDGKKDERLKEIADILTKAGFKVDIIEGNVEVPIWRKLLANVACNAIAALTGFTGNQLLGCEFTREIIIKLAEETAAVAKAKGLNFEELNYAGAFVLRALSGVKDNKISMLQDIEAKRKTEIDTLNGAVCVEGAKYGVATPYNDSITLLVKALEQKILWEKQGLIK
jgi:2-dehydropantoate 2-reductase